MKFVSNLSTQHSVIIVSFKNISYCAVLFIHVIQGTYCAIRNKISMFIFLENPMIL